MQQARMFITTIKSFEFNMRGSNNRTRFSALIHFQFISFISTLLDVSIISSINIAKKEMNEASFEFTYFSRNSSKNPTRRRR